jgi:hypothetical protein
LEDIKSILTTIGHAGVEALRADVEKVSATGKTKTSIRFEVFISEELQKLSFYGRKYFKTIESGRGPRHGTKYDGFDKSMYEYMQARGIGADLPEKKRRNLARFLTLKINKEGDKTFKEGGRIVYSPTITKLVEETKQAVAKLKKKEITSLIVNELKYT